MFCAVCHWLQRVQWACSGFGAKSNFGHIRTVLAVQVRKAILFEGFFVAQQPDALPLQQHPECVTMGKDHLSCSRCGRNVQRYHATSVRQFWESRCYTNRAYVHLPAVARSVAVRNKTRAKHQGVVGQLAAEHGHPLIWAGERKSSIRCTTCEWRRPLFDMIRQKKQYETLAPACTGNTGKSCSL